MWDYALYLTLSVTFPASLVVPALFALITTGATMLLSSQVGKLIDSYPRLNVVASSTALQNVRLL